MMTTMMIITYHNHSQGLFVRALKPTINQSVMSCFMGLNCYRSWKASAPWRRGPSPSHRRRGPAPWAAAEVARTWWSRRICWRKLRRLEQREDGRMAGKLQRSFTDSGGMSQGFAWQAVKFEIWSISSTWKCHRRTSVNARLVNWFSTITRRIIIEPWYQKSTPL